MNSPPQSRWTYVEIFVYDGERVLNPTHFCGTDVTFKEPPAIESEVVTVVTKNGDRTLSRTVRVLKHDPTDLRIPIELIGEPQVTHESSNENASTKLSA